MSIRSYSPTLINAPSSLELLLVSPGDPRCTDFVRADGLVYYQTSNDSGRTSLVRGAGGPGKEGEVAGYINWSRPSTIGMADLEPSAAGDFLRPGQDETRTFTGPYGEEYVWRKLLSSHDLELYALGSSRTKPIVVFRTERTHWFKKNEPAYLDISSAGEDILDYVILTWIFMRKLQVSNNSMFNYSNPLAP